MTLCITVYAVISLGSLPLQTAQIPHQKIENQIFINVKKNQLPIIFLNNKNCLKLISIIFHMPQ